MGNFNLLNLINFTGEGYRARSLNHQPRQKIFIFGFFIYQYVLNSQIFLLSNHHHPKILIIVNILIINFHNYLFLFHHHYHHYCLHHPPILFLNFYLITHLWGQIDYYNYFLLFIYLWLLVNLILKDWIHSNRFLFTN